MSQLSEQFSEVRNSQLEAQFEFIRNFTGKAFESVEKIIALNFDASRASLEKSSAAMRQIVAAKDPRDLLALSGEPQAQFDSVLAYSRQLFDIAVGVPPLFGPAPAPAPIAAKMPAAPAPAVAAEPIAAPSVEQPAAKPPVRALVVTKPEASHEKAKPIVKAAGKPEPLPLPSAATFPAPSASKPAAQAQVKPVDAAPPHAPVSGTPEVVSKKAAAAKAKPARKK